MEDPKCIYCGERFSLKTMHFHVMDCEKNPANMKKEEPKEELVEEPVEEPVTKPKKKKK